jgi:hypothetical protein
MSEFCMPVTGHAATLRWQALSDFCRGFIEAAFFTSTGSGDDADLEHADFRELDLESLKTAVRWLKRWRAAHADLLTEAFELPGGYDCHRAGADLWFTINGHGCGFWDRTELDANGLGDRLSQAAGRREITLYRGDSGAIYMEGFPRA